jgi:catechol 2,3-dioxygenase-like lactoylglutathione lyase family enzyme
VTAAGLHHLSLGVTSVEASARFYDAVLAPLGLVRVWSDLRPGEPRQAVGYGVRGGGDVLALKHRPAGHVAGAGFHVAFAAPSREAVHRFHDLAVQHGGRSDGAPGVRPAYGEHYYAAFVVDPDGHRLEAVIDRPESDSEPAGPGPGV